MQRTFIPKLLRMAPPTYNSCAGPGYVPICIDWMAAKSILKDNRRTVIFAIGSGIDEERIGDECIFLNG